MLTRRPLPEGDRAAETLADADRAFAARQWLGRASGELESTRAFRWIAEACEEIGAGAEMIALARRAVADEERHGEICRRVAVAYAGTDAIPEVSPLTTVALHVPDDFPLSVALYIVESCCLSETIGAVTIESALRASTAAMPRAALRELLADEINHARMGWAYLGAPHLGGRLRTEIAEHLPACLQAMFDYWKQLVADATPPATVAHGVLPFEQLDELIRTAFEDIALPGFRHVGIDTRGAEAFLSRC